MEPSGAAACAINFHRSPTVSMGCSLASRAATIPTWSCSRTRSPTVTRARCPSTPSATGSSAGSPNVPAGSVPRAAPRRRASSPRSRTFSPFAVVSWRRCATSSAYCGLERSKPASPDALALDQASPDRIHGGLDAVLDLQLHEDVRDVVLHRLRTDVELLGNLRVVLAVGDQPKDFGLAVGELRPADGIVACRAVGAHALKDLGGDVRRDQGLADRRGADPLHQILDRRILQEVAAGAG